MPPPWTIAILCAIDRPKLVGLQSLSFTVLGASARIVDRTSDGPRGDRDKSGHSRKRRRYSALFQGHSVWLYGDTFIAKANAENQTLLSDSWSFTTDLSAQGGITGFQERLDSAGAPTMILAETPAEQAFNQAHNINNCQAQPCGARWALWPSSIVVSSRNGRH
jgi:hypothetical protein